MVLEEQPASAVCKPNAVSVENIDLRPQLSHIEQIDYSMKYELAHNSNATRILELVLIELRNLLDDERNGLLQNLQINLSKLSEEKQ